MVNRKREAESRFDRERAEKLKKEREVTVQKEAVEGMEKFFKRKNPAEKTFQVVDEPEQEDQILEKYRSNEAARAFRAKKDTGTEVRHPEEGVRSENVYGTLPAFRPINPGSTIIGQRIVREDRGEIIEKPEDEAFEEEGAATEIPEEERLHFTIGEPKIRIPHLDISGDEAEDPELMKIEGPKEIEHAQRFGNPNEQTEENPEKHIEKDEINLNKDETINEKEMRIGNWLQELKS